MVKPYYWPFLAVLLIACSSGSVGEPDGQSLPDGEDGGITDASDPGADAGADAASDPEPDGGDLPADQGVDGADLPADAGEDGADGAGDGDGAPEKPCGVEPLPAPTGDILTVGSVSELEGAVSQANDTGQITILLADGKYQLNDMLIIRGDHVTVRSASGDRDKVEIRGAGMNGGISHIFNVGGDYFTAADMTIGWVANHAIQIQGNMDADYPLIHNVRFVDTYEQMLKVSYDSSSNVGSNGGIVEGCLFEYPEGIGPQYYIGGVDGHRATGWIVRYNTFKNIRSPDDTLAEYAIHFWSDSENTLVEGNRIVNCDRGIGFGMGDRGHQGGIIRNNMVHTTRDVSISLETCPDALVVHNSVFTENFPNSIEYRFSATRNVTIMNNLTNAAIQVRDGASASLQTNVTTGQTDWFVAPTDGDLHLTGSGPAPVIDRATSLEEVTVDFDCQARPRGSGPDIGADEL